MWTTPVLLIIIACSWRVAESRESLRDQLAMLRQEQWRDKERIEALERKVVIREERETSPHALGDVLEEVRREVEELTEELKGRQELESSVQAMQVKMEQGLTALRHMSAELGALKNEQKRMWRELAAVRQANTRLENNTRGKATLSGDPFSEEGSGDLVAESFLPVGGANKEISEVKRAPQNEHSLRNNFLEEQKNYFLQLEQKVHQERSQMKQHLEEVKNRALETRGFCEQLVSNATEKVLATTSHVQNLEERFNHMRQSVARLEFNVAQSQAALDVVANDRAADRGRITYLKVMAVPQNQTDDEWNRAETVLEQQRNRIINLELMTTNITLQRCKVESQVASRDLKLANMELWLTQADRRLDENSRRVEIARRSDENIIRSLREAIVTVSKKVDNTSEEIQQLVTQQARIKDDLELFVKQLPTDCSKATENGVTLIKVDGLGPTEVFCDVKTTGGPWLVFQRRFNGTENFFRNWSDYQNGFGNPSSEFWLGNEILHRITNKLTPVKLRIDLWDVIGRYLYAEYKKFIVKSEEELYALEVGQHRGNATDALRHHSGMGFSTHDRDNDASSTHCAVHYTGGWWYQHCHRADLNGRYALGMTWYDDFSRDWIQLEKVEMKMARDIIST